MLLNRWIPRYKVFVKLDIALAIHFTLNDALMNITELRLEYPIHSIDWWQLHFFLYNNSFSIICNNFWFINLFLYLKMLILLYFINLLYYINIFNLYWKITTFYHHIRILSIARIEIYTRFKLHDNINHLTFNTPTARQNYTCSRQFL